MKGLLVTAAVLVPVTQLVTQLHVAHAGSCHGGGGGGSSGGSSGSSGGGYSSSYGSSGYRYYPNGPVYGDTSVVLEASGSPRCEDASDVIGYRRCTKFGAWAKDLRMPRIAIEGGVIARQFGSLLDSQTGSVIHGNQSFAYRVMGTTQSHALDTAVLSTLRATVGLPHGLYTGVEVDLGGITQAGRASTEMMTTGSFGSPDLEQRKGFLVDSLGTIGVRGATHAGGLGVELAGGVRAVSYSFHSSYHGCEQMTSVVAFAPVAEARVRGELWLSPWLTAGATVGTSMLEKHTWMGGLYLGVHTRAFGGER